MQFAGTYTAIVTPFRDDAEQRIDLEAYDALVEHQIKGGITGIVPCGTTGESPTLSDDEQVELIRRTVAVAKGRCKVIAGTGANSTKKTIESSKRALEAGADAVMVVVPYYNKPTQDGLFAHYVQVAKNVPCPMVVYNIPGRTGIDLLPDTLARIAAECPNVVATKEATGNVLRAQQILASMGDRMTVLSGDDALTLPMMASGAKGVISVTSNVYPKQVGEVVNLMLAGKLEEARKAHLALCPVHDVMFVESNPAPAKAALAWKKLCGLSVRGPLAPASESARTKVQAVLAAYEARA